MTRVNYMELGVAIQDRRRSLNLTQEQLAELVDCGLSHISNIENAYTKPSLGMLLSIANALETTLDSLLQTQYVAQSNAIINEIVATVAKCDEETQKTILRVIKAFIG